ncbi:MAG: PD-(D/E)XK nuclease family protein [Polyangiaceae bacterium]|nr:PD-(D/E)XK nuclease family protein [Polyangiaceae bacterium]
MHDGELFVVPGERHVERLAREGHRAETRAALRSRLAVALLPNVAFADARECRLVLGMALDDVARNQKVAPSRQLDLFASEEGDAAPADAALAHDALAAAHARGGASWTGMTSALDDAITTLRARGVTVAMLERVAARRSGVMAERARTLATAMTALDAHLVSFGAHDERLAGAMLAQIIAASDARDLVGIVGAARLRARWLLKWEPSDLLWWRALDDKLSPRGFARIVLPAFEHRLEGTREPDPLETLTEDVARLLDAAPESETIVPVLGDLSLGSSLAPDLRRVSLLQVGDAAAQAREAVSIIDAALRGGASLERIVVALPVTDERTLGPLRRAFNEASIASFDGRGTSPSQAPIVACAFAVLDVADTLLRQDVARLLQSGYVDAPRLGPPGAAARDVGRALVRIAHKLETRATAAGEDSRSRLVRTVTSHGRGAFERVSEEEDALDEAISTRLAEVLEAPAQHKTRIDRIVAARAVWSALGLGARAGRGGLSTFRSDDAPVGVARAERDAIARDARAWDALLSAMDLYERIAHRANALDQLVDPVIFHSEIVNLLDASSASPSAGRAGAVRVLRLEDVVGDALDLLVILDANDGLLPRDEPHDALVSETFIAALSPLVPRRARELSALAAAASDAAHIVMISVREDEAGAPLLPSPIVTSLVRAGLPVASARKESDIANVTRDLALRIRREREREGFFLDPQRPRSDVVGELVATPEMRAVLARATGGGTHARAALAVTSLERFARCPFQGYAHAVIAAREAQVYEELPDAREEGTLVHDALAAAFTATQGAWLQRPRDCDAIVDAGLRATDEILDRWQGHAPLRAVVRLRVRDCVRAVLVDALADEEWNFVLAEKSFGGRDDGGWPAFVIEGACELVVLRGTIDRIDRARGGTSPRVVDYKRSKSTVREASKGLGVTALQVPLYACVAAKMLGGEAAGTYVPFLPRDVLDAAMNEQIETTVRDLAMRMESSTLSLIEHRALSLVTRVRSGGLAPIPADESACRVCAVSGGCRKPRFAMAPLDDDEEA